MVDRWNLTLGGGSVAVAAAVASVIVVVAAAVEGVAVKAVVLVA